MKYYIKTVEDCTPKIYQFKTKKELDKFKTSFLKKVDNQDTWIEFIFKGEMLYSDRYYE